MTPITLSPETIAGLSPGIRDTVIFLNQHGFETTDSGDGSLYAEGMECACPIPMVAIRCTPETIVSESDRLRRVLFDFTGVAFDEDVPPEKAPRIEGVYWPLSKTAMILMTNIIVEKR